MSGLGAFAVGHLAYVGAAVAVGFDAAWAVPGVAFMLAMLGFRFATRTVPGARRAGGTGARRGAVVFYACVISAMVVTAWATAAWVAAAGAMLFAVSDWVLGHQRFVGPAPGRSARGDGAVPRRPGAADRRARHGLVARAGTVRRRCRGCGCSGTGRW